MQVLLRDRAEAKTETPAEAETISARDHWALICIVVESIIGPWRLRPSASLLEVGSPASAP